MKCSMQRSKSLASQLFRRPGVVLGMVLGTFLSVAAPRVATSDTPRAVWRLQEIPFVYQGYSTRYSCDSLRLKVKQVLGAVAVHESTIVPTSCNMIGSSSQIASMQISVMSAAPLTPATEAEIAARSSRQELLDRLGVRRELNDEFPAQWREVDVGRQLNMDAGDCEFLRQLGDQVLSHLAVRIVDIEKSCPSTPRRFKQPKLKVEALVPLTIDGVPKIADIGR